jgi:hypothetical protein
MAITKAMAIDDDDNSWQDVRSLDTYQRLFSKMCPISPTPQANQDDGIM